MGMGHRRSLDPVAEGDACGEDCLPKGNVPEGPLPEPWPGTRPQIPCGRLPDDSASGVGEASGVQSMQTT